MFADIAKAEALPSRSEIPVREIPAQRTSKGAPPKPRDTLNALAAKEKGADRDKRPRKKESAARADDGKKNAQPKKSRTEQLNFRVTREFRKAFKRAVAASGCKKHELLERMLMKWNEAAPS